MPTSEEVEARAKLHFKYSEDAEGGDARRYGIMMHRLFERIIILDDVDQVINWMEREGENVDGLRSEVDEILAIEGVTELFDERWRVMNEAEIFDGKNGRIYRPDRVMISGDRAVVVDYKFGDKINKYYNRQMSEYISLLRSMNKYNTIIK